MAPRLSVVFSSALSLAMFFVVYFAGGRDLRDGVIIAVVSYGIFFLVSVVAGVSSAKGLTTI